jgi:uncharacterized protein YvpB
MAGTVRRPWIMLAAPAVIVAVSVPLLAGASPPRSHQDPATAISVVSSPAASPSPEPSATPSVAPRPTAPPPAAAAAPAHPWAPQAPAPPPPPPGPPPITLAVPWSHQQYNLSCEEASLSMVLAFFGHPTTEQQIFNQIGIDWQHYSAGNAGGGDPYERFVGDPNGSQVRQTGYGVYWPPIDAAAGSFGAPVVQAGEGIAPATIYRAIRAGHPALVWVTYDMLPHVRADYQAYDGRSIPYAGPEEHAMVVTGIDGNAVRLNDPDRGQYWVTFARFEAAYAVYGQMGVVFGGPVATPVPTHVPTPLPTPTPTPVPTPTPTPTPVPTPTPTPTPVPSATPSA